MRVRGLERQRVAKEIRDAAIRIVHAKGKFQEVGNLPIKVPEARFGDFTILLTTPFVKVEGMPASYGIDIWTKEGKVFSVWWEENQSLDIVRMKLGEWVTDLLAEAAKQYPRPFSKDE